MLVNSGFKTWKQMAKAAAILALGPANPLNPARRSGSMMLRQLHFSELDLVLHSQYTPQEGGSVFDSEVVKRVEERTTILRPLPEDRFLCGFSHIFAGGYAGRNTAQSSELMSCCL